jgi:hypothetical protein
LEEGEWSKVELCIKNRVASMSFCVKEEEEEIAGQNRGSQKKCALCS